MLLEWSETKEGYRSTGNYIRESNKTVTEKVELKINFILLRSPKLIKTTGKLRLPHHFQELNCIQNNWFLCQQWPN